MYFRSVSQKFLPEATVVFRLSVRHRKDDFPFVSPLVVRDALDVFKQDPGRLRATQRSVRYGLGHFEYRRRSKAKLRHHQEHQVV